MHKPKIFFEIIQRTIALLTITFSASCGTLDQYHGKQNNLDLSIKAFNSEFESKAIETSGRFVHPNHRAKFMGQSLDVIKRVTFYEATVLDMRFFKNGVPANITSGGPEKDFDRSVVIIRYQAAVLPSAKIETIFSEQEWILVGEQWLVIPNLSPLLD